MKINYTFSVIEFFFFKSDPSGVWFTGERERNISEAFGREWLSGAHAHKAEYWAERHTAPLHSHAL